MLRLERLLEKQEYDVRVAANVPLCLAKYDLNTSAPQHHVAMCRDYFGKKATEHFAGQLQLVQQYHISPPVLHATTVTYTVTEHSTRQQRTLTCPLPVHAHNRTHQHLTTSFILGCEQFRCSCNSDISLGVPCRHILRMLQEHSISFADRMRYFHERWKINTKPPMNMLKNIFIAPPSKHGKTIAFSDLHDDGGADDCNDYFGDNGEEEAFLQEQLADDNHTTQFDPVAQAAKSPKERLADITQICVAFANL